MKQYIIALIVLCILLVFGIIYLWLKYQTLEDTVVRLHKKIADRDNGNSVNASYSCSKPNKEIKKIKKQPKQDNSIMSITFQSELVKGPKSKLEYKNVTKSEAENIFGKSETENFDSEANIILNKAKYIEDSDIILTGSSYSDDFDGTSVHVAKNLLNDVPDDIPPEFLQEEDGKSSDHHNNNRNRKHIHKYKNNVSKTLKTKKSKKNESDSMSDIVLENKSKKVVKTTNSEFESESPPQIEDKNSARK